MWRKVLFIPFLLFLFYNESMAFSIAILEPISMTDNIELFEKNIIRAEITKAITSINGFSAFTRLDIDQIVREQNFQQTGMVDDETRKRIGVLQGVDALCITKITKEENAFYIETNLLDIESGEIINPATKYFEWYDNDIETVIAACEDLTLDFKLGDEIFIIVESMPEFPGGQQALLKFIADTIKYPVIAQENGIQGRVVCEFVIEKDGKISDIQVVRSSNEPSLDKEAIRVISIMPSWKPGRQRGKPVRVKYILPINFHLK